MSQAPVILDPKALRLFVSQMKAFNTALANDSASLQAQFRKLGETWRDPAYAQFAQEFEQTMKNLYRFRQICDDVTPKLIRTAERAEVVHGG